MLDNLQATTMSPAATKTMPMEILADAKVEAATAAKPYKSHKTKTILNWLKNTTTATATTTKTIQTSQHNNNSEIINSCQRNQLDTTTAKETQQQRPTSESCACATLPVVGIGNGIGVDVDVNGYVTTDTSCTCSLLKHRNNTHHTKHNSNILLIAASSCSPSATLPHSDETLREFRGVQTLKHFWNKRITANKESALRAKSSKHSQQLFTKSQSCLVTNSNQTGEPPPAQLSSSHLPASFAGRKLRAQSLHDCSQGFEELGILSDIELQTQIHLEKDNFYKYKTAEQATKLRELSEHSASRRFSAGIILPLVQGFQKGERWFAKRKSASSLCTTLAKPEQLVNNENVSDNTDMASVSDIVINDANPSSTTASSLPRVSCQNGLDSVFCRSESSESSPTLTAANSPSHRNAIISPKRRRSAREDAQKVNDSPAAVSRNSSSTSLTHSSGGGNTSRSASVKRNSTSRKYSFKTHTRNYHAPRRMHNQKDTANTSASVVHHHPPSSLVAKLTQRFNEIIQDDRNLLEKVKRKNGVLMTHKGHVYKVVETGKSTQPSSLSRTSSKSLNLLENGDSSPKDNNTPMDNILNSSSAVQKTIKKFETVSRNSAKPKVPSKSLKVLKKSNELVINKVGKVIYPPRAIMINPRDSESKNPPQSLIIPKSLEMVKEEAKTPVEAKNSSTCQMLKEDAKTPVEAKNSSLCQMLIEEAKTPVEAKNASIEDEKETSFRKCSKEDLKSVPNQNLQISNQTAKETQSVDHQNPGNCCDVKETPPDVSITECENQRNLKESWESTEIYQEAPNTERIYSNDEKSSPINVDDLENKSSIRMREKNRNLSHEQRDSFFEEILKDPKKNEDDELKYKTIARKSKVIRRTSIIVDDPQKNLLIYINDKTDKKVSRSSQIFDDSKENSNTNSSDKSSTKSLNAKEHLYSRPAPNKDLAKELARELNEKLSNHPKFLHPIEVHTGGDTDEPLTKEFKIEECKEVDETYCEVDGQRTSCNNENKDNKQALMEMIKMSKELKDKTNNEMLSELNKDEKSSNEDIYNEIISPSESPEIKKSKTKHSKFYEKIKFLTMPRKSQKSIHISGSPKTEELLPLSECQPLPSSSELQSYTPMRSPVPQKKGTREILYSSMYDPESKLLDALQQVDEKLHSLSKPEEQELVVVEKLVESDEYGHHIKPNSSFLHQSYAKELPNKPTLLIQAVNVTLVNAIEGEQMIMEQKEIIEQVGAETEEQASEKEESNKSLSIEEEPLYEPIGFVQIEREINQTLKTEPNYIPCPKTNEPTEDDIYQSVEEIVTKVYAKTPSPPPPPPPLRLLADYEVIEESIINTLSLNCHLQTAKAPQDFDGYEECSPTPLDPAIISSTTSTNISSSSSPGIRKTTDELPDLPKPKRILPKSPIPLRSSPKTTPLATPSVADISPLPISEESHYYVEEEEENIYDTIKGFHCYESLQSVDNKLEKSASACTKTSDTLSLNSNCYESIYHFKPFRVPSHHSSSSHGSTLTISSENKTNSLYEDSLGPILQYTRESSKRIYRRANTEAHIDMQQQQTKRRNSSVAYNSSMGRASDTSDEWTDVTDNEQGDEEGEEQKPQFIIVRSKAHKSPDWSRRVRDKRLHHQRKSQSFIEDDDPDHYYEQLSPSALTKRHSLGIQERTGSLQRNQEAVRVSKRGKQISYSAHALGQEISDDSFDSDTDDYYESEHFKNSHNDSGVDIRTSKLPDPPSSSNQMYAFVKKFKNFIGGNKKSPNSSKHGGSQQKIDDTSSQFYVNGNFYSPGSGGGGGNAKASSLQVPQTKELSTSEKNLIMAQSNVTKAEQLNASTTPRKSKAGKSLRSRLRKSLVGFDNKQLQALTPTRSTFYVEDPCHPDDTNGQLDSGFSEKASSGDIPNSTNTSASSTAATDTHKFATLARKAKKEAKSSNTHRRRTTIGIRPIEPPPPPPDNNVGARRQSNTSWYAECGVFKNGTTNLVNDDTQILNGQNGTGNMTSGASWYEEAGLYQTSGVSVASSSGSSGVSTSTEAGGPADEMSHSMFSNEPLYQIYSAAKLEAISRDMHDEGSTDGYEEVGDRRRSIMGVGDRHRKSARQTALELVEKERGPARTLWSQIPEVVNSLIIPTMTPRERALMEAKFEVITSEASYLKSLNLLRSHFMNHPVFRDQNLVNSRDRKALFAHIVPVHDCSERLLTELESCWQDNIMLIGLSKRIYAIAEKHFHVYIAFCEYQGRMDRTLKRLRLGKGLFSQNLELLESSDSCCGLNLHSFLMLPMQRITRLPLLIDAVFSKCDPNDDEYDNWKMCLAIINKIVTQCNEAATKSDQAFEIEKISRQLEFNPSVIRPLAIAPAGVLAPGTKPRFLVKKGEFTHLIWRGDDAKLTFGKKFTKTSIYAFLFSDLLVLTKRKGEEQFSVFDYCPRNMLTITSGDTLPQLPNKDLNSQTSKNLILMTLLENHERKTNELLLSCPSVSEQERWLQAMRPPESETPGEKLYEQWDCPQVMANHAYENNEPDGLSLEVGDVVNVTRKLPDGWYQGERIRDGAVGWFPGSYTEEVNSAHVRARNLKLRHRLLTFTATYLESQKRNK